MLCVCESSCTLQAGRPINAASLLPDLVNGRRPYVHYAGSLTTPPCSEGVDWFVMTDPILATDEQVWQLRVCMCVVWVGGGGGVWVDGLHQARKSKTTRKTGHGTLESPGGCHVLLQAQLRCASERACHVHP
jgi:hypothetical protein